MDWPVLQYLHCTVFVTLTYLKHAAQSYTLGHWLFTQIPDVWFQATCNKVFDSTQWATCRSIEDIGDNFVPPFILQIMVPSWCCTLPLSINTGFKCLQYADKLIKKQLLATDVMSQNTKSHLTCPFSTASCSGVLSSKFRSEKTASANSLLQSIWK